jgi:hypothetical protein
LAILAAIRRALAARVPTLLRGPPHLLSSIVVVIIGIRIYKLPHPDAVIGLVSHSPDICDTAFIKGFGIAIRAIVFVVNAMLFRPPVAGFVSRAIDGAVEAGVCSIVRPCRIDEGKHCKDRQSHDRDIGAHDRLDLTPALLFQFLLLDSARAICRHCE